MRKGNSVGLFSGLSGELPAVNLPEQPLPYLSRQKQYSNTVERKVLRTCWLNNFMLKIPSAKTRILSRESFD
jgi:hypothetical protein